MKDQITVAYREGFEFGMGVRSASASPKGLGVVGAVTGVEGAGAGHGEFYMSRIESFEDLERELGISAEASAGVGCFSASARFDFAQRCKVQSHSLFLLLSATEQLGFKQIDDPALSDAAAELTNSGDMELFLDRYGDGFVRGMQSGGQFFGMFRLSFKSQQSKESISGDLHGAYGAFSGKASSTFEEAVSSSDVSVEVFVYHEGGKVTGQPTDPQQLLAAAREWRATVEQFPLPYAVTIAPYVLARGPKMPNEADLLHQRDVLVRCAKLRSRTIEYQNLVDYVQDPNNRANLQIVPPPEGPDLGALQASLALDIDMIGAAASFAIDHPKEAMEVEIFARKQKELPDYKLTVLPANMPALNLGKEPVVVPPAPGPVRIFAGIGQRVR